MRWSMLTTALAAAFAAGCQGFDFRPGPPSPLRLLTYNTALISAPVAGELNSSQFGMDDETRAKIIAAQILEDDADVVVLNEVFDDVIAGLIVKELFQRYPSWVETIDGDAESDVLKYEGDSGLMLFSKHPFIEFSQDAHPFWRDIDHLNARNDGVDWWDSPHKLAAVLYRDCVGDDCKASKVVAMVRMQHKDSGTPFSVAFTHMQAVDPAGGEDDAQVVDVRKWQMLYVRWLITSCLTPEQLASEPVFFMGDLNIPGGNGGAPNNSAEWIYHCDTPNRFFAMGDGAPTFDGSQVPADPLHVPPDAGSFMADGWGFGTSKTDEGVTNADDGERYDFILHNRPVHDDRPNMVLQHIAIAWELGEQTADGWMDYSDHLGVRADFNAAAPRCSPNDEAGILGPARVQFIFVPDREFTDALTEIHYPGGMQWYRIDDAGSYQISLSGPNKQQVQYLVYHHKDLSRPIGSYHKESNELGDKYVLPDPPYYIRVFGKTRTWTGPYVVKFHRNLGRTRSDSISLLANTRMPYTWPGPSTVPSETPDTKIWFDFYTDVASSGHYPTTRIMQEFLTGYPVVEQYHAEIVTDEPPTADANGEPVYDVVAKDSGVLGNNPNNGNVLMDFLTGPLDGGADGPRKYYARLWREPAEQGIDQGVVLVFGTTLTYFRPLRLTALDAWDDDPEDDQLEIRFAFDGDLAPINSGPAVELEFDSEQFHPLTGFAELSGSFAERIVLHLSEEGDYMPPLFFANGLNSVDALPHAFGMLSNGLPQAVKVEWTDGPNVDEADYWYDLDFLLSSEVFPSCADAPGALGCWK